MADPDDKVWGAGLAWGDPDLQIRLSGREKTYMDSLLWKSGMKSEGYGRMWDFALNDIKKGEIILKSKIKKIVAMALTVGAALAFVLAGGTVQALADVTASEIYVYSGSSVDVAPSGFIQLGIDAEDSLGELFVDWEVSGNTDAYTAVYGENDDWTLVDVVIGDNEEAEYVTVTATCESFADGSLITRSIVLHIVDPGSGAAYVTGISIEGPDSLHCGEGGSFTANVTGEGDFNDSVIWDVSGGTSAGTTISDDGYLTIGEDEKAESVTVWCTSIDNGEYVATQPVTVVQGYIIISASADTAIPGSAIQLTEEHSEDITEIVWVMFGNPTSTGTFIDDSGVLHIGKDEATHVLEVLVRTPDYEVWSNSIKLPVEKIQHKDGWDKDENGIWHYYINGTLATGWQKIDGTWYYMDEDGNMLTGWQKVGGVWYYFKDGGQMVTGWQKIGGTWYFFNGSGAMVTGWQKIGGTWYFFKSSGAMVTGWYKDGSTWYFFKSSGAMAASEWCEGYWLNSNGSWTYQPRGSWKQDSKGWWFGDTSGWYAKNTTVKIDNVNYRFNASGYWVK